MKTIKTNIVPEALNNPLDLSDIMNVCKEYTSLGTNLQYQTQMVLDLGVEEAIKSRAVSIAALPHIRAFLKTIAENSLFGEAAMLATDCLFEIEMFETSHPRAIALTN